MKILLVANYLPDSQQSMLRFADSLLLGFLERGESVEMIRPPCFFGRLNPGQSSQHGLGKWLGYLDKFVLFPSILKRRAAWSEVVHICDHSNAHYTACLQGIPHLVTCHDLLAIRSALGEFPQNPTRATGRVLQRWILKGLNRTQAISCVSEATRRDVLRLTEQKPEAVRVTHMGMNYPYSPLPSEGGKAGNGYLLHVGGGQWYKNREGVLAIYRELRKGMGEATPRLIMVGPLMGELPEGVEIRHGVGNEELCRLYSDAALMLYPSLEEGFGWPIVEAQACGCRVVTTGKAPMTEVGGGSAFYLDDPTDAVAAARLVALALAEPAQARRGRIAQGLANAAEFSTGKMLSQYLSLYQQLITR